MSSQWKKVAYLAVGGLTEVGFAAGSLLLVVSHQGRGVVDLASGELLVSESEEIRAVGFSFCAAFWPNGALLSRI